MIGKMFILLSLITSSALFGANIFDIVVNEQNLIKGFPDSLHHIRQYWKFKNPGHFYKIFSPLYFVLAITALFFSWESEMTWIFTIAAILFYGATQLITIIYFFPVNKVLRDSPISEAEALLKKDKVKRFWLDLIRNFFTLLSSFLLGTALIQ